MNRSRIVIATVMAVVVVGGAAVYFDHRGGSGAAASRAEAAAPDSPATALVKTMPPTESMMSTTVTTYGDVAASRTVAVSFPYAGQVSRLFVLQGQHVAAGAPLATLVGDPAAQAASTQAESALGFANAELKRQKDLFALQLATQSQVDAARKAVDDAKSNLEVQRKLGVGSGGGTSTITAPVEGVVTALTVALGDRIQPGAPLMQLGDASGMKVLIGIEPAERGVVAKGARVTLSSVQDPDVKFDSTISDVQNFIDPKTQLMSAVVRLPKEAERVLIPGMHIKATIVAKQQKTISVPRQAVLSDDKSDYIFQVVDRKARRVDVVSEVNQGDDTGISGPIDPNAHIVTLGNYELTDGMPVREEAR